MTYIHYNLNDMTVLHWKVGTVSPCGFCGRDGCTIQLLQHSTKRFEVKSNCMYHYDFNYHAAAKSNATTPTTNVPLFCPLCPAHQTSGIRPTFWKYNLDDHLRAEHATDSGTAPTLSRQDLMMKHISLAEGRAIGVPEATLEGWRASADIPDSSDIEQLPVADSSGSRTNILRKRAGTVTTTAANVTKRSR